jgi:hypothetical protein
MVMAFAELGTTPSQENSANRTKLEKQATRFFARIYQLV